MGVLLSRMVLRDCFLFICAVLRVCCSTLLWSDRIFEDKIFGNDISQMYPVSEKETETLRAEGGDRHIRCASLGVPLPGDCSGALGQ